MSETRPSSPPVAARDRAGSVTLRRTVDALDRMSTPEGIQASDSHLFRDAVFGRDSAQVGLDVVRAFPHRAAAIVTSLAVRQGLHHDPRTEEEPGRIHHEWRSEWIGPVRASPASVDIMGLLQSVWGDPDADTLCYYGTVDATCLYVRLVRRVVEELGPASLEAAVRRVDGGETTIRRSVQLAAEWVHGRVTSSPLSLLELQRTNPDGLPWQALRDGVLSYQHADGSPANADGPIASLEVQGLAYDALVDAAALLGAGASREWGATAASLREATWSRFGAPLPSGLCMALDRDPTTGAVRQVQVATTLPGELLESAIVVDEASEAEVEARVAPIVAELFSPSFLTAVGLRARAREHRAALEPAPYAAYQGSLASWPVMTNIVARGLRRVGLDALAGDLEARVLAGIEHSGRYAEGWVVDEDGAIEAAPGEEPSSTATIATTSRYEAAQAWTVSAALRALVAAGRTTEPAAGWRGDLARTCLSSAAGITVASVPHRRFHRDVDAAIAHERTATAAV